MNLAEQFVQNLEDGKLGPLVVPASAIQTYLGACGPKSEPEAHRQLTILKMFLDTQLLPIGIEKATESLCKRLAERMVKAGDWSENALGQFGRWPPEADATH